MFYHIKYGQNTVDNRQRPTYLCSPARRLAEATGNRGQWKLGLDQPLPPPYRVSRCRRTSVHGPLWLRHLDHNQIYNLILKMAFIRFIFTFLAVGTVTFLVGNWVYHLTKSGWVIPSFIVINLMLGAAIGELSMRNRWVNWWLHGDE